MTSLDDFTANVASSGLVDPESLARHRALMDGRKDPEPALELARRLIQAGLLTSYQARKLLDGATRGFFLGGYRLLRPLGEGGMGKVFLAEGPGRDRVAIKVLPPKKILEEANALARFYREMELSKRCVHQNLARTIAVGAEGEIPYMVMEYIAGKSLYDIVRDPRRGPLRVPDAARLFLQLADGLESAHLAGLVHRDIKPSNIMITPGGDVKLLDMGLARAVDEDAGLTRAGVVLGTLDYASPEQLRDAASADVRSDLYSVGCTLYFALAGRPPFEGGNMINKIFRQRMEDPDRIEKIAKGVPAAFATIVRKLMNKKPEERYQNCTELKIDLARWLDPARVKSVLGAEALDRRAFRPPEILDDDLRLYDALTDPGGSPTLRELGSPLPSPAPRHRVPPPPLPASFRPLPAKAPASPRPLSDDARWLIQFGIIAALIGLVAIVAISLFYHS